VPSTITAEKKGPRLVVVNPYEISGRGGTRTRTSGYGQRILSPLRLPFRHSAFDPIDYSPLSFLHAFAEIEFKDLLLQI
jgi:hypothetical protein